MSYIRVTNDFRNIVKPVVIKINSSFLRYQDEYYSGE